MRVLGETGIRHITATFLSAERFGLTSQLNRAAVSVAANLAEGLDGTSPKDHAHFLQMSYGRLMESACLLMLFADQRLMLTAELERQRPAIKEISRQINALRSIQLDRVP